LQTEVLLTPILQTERREFLAMAQTYFSELNPVFLPHDDWKESYFEAIQGNPDCKLCWIMSEGNKAGFVLFGFERHRFLPRTNGAVYELYVRPDHRRRGIARACAHKAIAELKSAGPSKIQLEVAAGNSGATVFWTSLGFEKVAERYVLASEDR